MATEPLAFDREHGCTEAEWRASLPAAVGSHALSWVEAQRARVDIGSGTLELAWTPLPPRRIGVVALPRLAVHYAFRGVPAAERAQFMRRFDLAMQRGGG